MLSDQHLEKMMSAALRLFADDFVYVFEIS